MNIRHKKSVFELYRGRHTFEVFSKNLDKFFELTEDAYICGMPPGRDIAYSNWVAFIKSKKEAKFYFHAVDAFSPYT